MDKVEEAIRTIYKQLPKEEVKLLENRKWYQDSVAKFVIYDTCFAEFFVFPEKKYNDSCWINLAVLPEFRGEKWSYFLLSFLLLQRKKLPKYITKIIWSVSFDNSISIKLAEKLGFKKIGTRYNYFLYQLPLDTFTKNLYKIYHN